MSDIGNNTEASADILTEGTDSQSAKVANVFLCCFKATELETTIVNTWSTSTTKTDKQTFKYLYIIQELKKDLFRRVCPKQLAVPQQVFRFCRFIVVCCLCFISTSATVEKRGRKKKKKANFFVSLQSHCNQ